MSGASGRVSLKGARVMVKYAGADEDDVVNLWRKAEGPLVGEECVRGEVLES